MNQEAKYQLGLRERELMIHASEKEQGTKSDGPSTPRPVEESPRMTRAATTRELIVASVLEQAKNLMAEVTTETLFRHLVYPRHNMGRRRLVGKLWAQAALPFIDTPCAHLHSCAFFSSCLNLSLDASGVRAAEQREPHTQDSTA